MRAATEFKKETKIAAAYSNRGIVYIKLTGEDASVVVNSPDMLSDLVEKQLFRDPGESTNAL